MPTQDELPTVEEETDVNYLVFILFVWYHLLNFEVVVIRSCAFFSVFFFLHDFPDTGKI